MAAGFFSISPPLHHHRRFLPTLHHHIYSRNLSSSIPLIISCRIQRKSRENVCKAIKISIAEESHSSRDGGSSGSADVKNWVPVVPLAALLKGERRVIIKGGETILLLWYKDEVFAIENRQPKELTLRALLNAKLTQDGCIVCPTTDSAFDLTTGAVKECYPKNPVLRVLTLSLRTLFVYPVKTDAENIYISMGGVMSSDASTEIVFSRKAKPSAIKEWLHRSGKRSSGHHI